MRNVCLLSGVIRTTPNPATRLKTLRLYERPQTFLGHIFNVISFSRDWKPIDLRVSATQGGSSQCRKCLILSMRIIRVSQTQNHSHEMGAMNASFFVYARFAMQLGITIRPRTDLNMCMLSCQEKPCLGSCQTASANFELNVRRSRIPSRGCTANFD